MNNFVIKRRRIGLLPTIVFITVILAAAAVPVFSQKSGPSAPKTSVQISGQIEFQEEVLQIVESAIDANPRFVLSEIDDAQLRVIGKILEVNYQSEVQYESVTRGGETRVRQTIYYGMVFSLELTAQNATGTEKGSLRISLETDTSKTTKAGARADAMAELNEKVHDSIAELFPLAVTVISVDGFKVILSGGAELGLQRGQLYDVIDPETQKRIASIQIGKVESVQATGRIVSGYPVVEAGVELSERTSARPKLGGLIINSETGFFPYFGFFTDTNALFAGARLELSTFMFLSYGLDIAYGFNLSEIGGNMFLLGGYVAVKPLRTKILDLGLRAGFDWAFVNNVEDDEALLVIRQAVRFIGGLSINIHILRWFSLFIFGDYTVAISQGPWQRADRSFAVWNNDSPDPLAGGIFTGIGARFAF